MGVAREASSPAAAGLVFELKADREDEGQNELDERLAIIKELKVSGVILEIDGNRAVFAGRFSALSHVSPRVRWSSWLMIFHRDNILKY